MLYKLFFPCLLLVTCSAFSQQYKYDKVLYKTVNPDELCATLDNNKGYLLLDVRSKGEHYDTSQFTNLNIGHLKNAVNINVRELGDRLSEIQSYKNQPVFVYCSHSQRSRRASKMLADSGFTNVYNINGGLTSFYYTNARDKGCLTSLIETAGKYKLVSAIDLCNKLNSNKQNIFLLDVRTDSAFKHISTDEQANAYGYIKTSVNIPLAEMEKRIAEIPATKEIIIIDLNGSEASKAASLLANKGYKNVSFLIEGINRLLNTDEKDISCKNAWYVTPVPYQILSSKAFGRMATGEKNIILLDVRDTAVFSNRHKDAFRNIGHLKNAINIPTAEISSRLGELENYKNDNLVIYSFSSNQETYEVAKKLLEKGFTKINILAGGIFDIRWTASNIQGQEYLNGFVMNVPEINR